MSHLLPNVVEATYRSGIVLVSILRVWIENHEDLLNLAIQFLEERSTAKTESTDQEEGSSDDWTLTERAEAIEEFQAQHDDLDKDELALIMLCCINGGTSITALKEELNGSEPTMKWHQWLEELKALPADAPEWEEEAVAEFVEALMHLKENKRLEGLSSELQTLMQQAIEGLKFFEMLDDVSSWTAENCSASEYIDVAAKVAEFRAAILTYQELKQQPEASSFSETVRLRGEKTRLERTINQLHDQIHSTLTSSTPELPPPEPPNKPFSGIEEVKKGKTPEASDSAPSKREAAEEEENEVKEETGRTAEPPQDNHERPIVEKELVLEEGGKNLSKDLDTPEPNIATSPLLSPSQEIATDLQDNDSENEQHSLVWSLISEDDLPSAYWLLRSFTASRQVPPVPDYLLAAAQGACWLKPSTETFVDDLRNITAREEQTPSNDVQALARLAAALYPALVAPRSGMLNWLQVPDCCPELHDLVTAVKGFARHNTALQPEDLRGIAGVAQRKDALGQVAIEVQHWLKEAPYQRLKLKRASAVWQHLVRPQGKLREFLLPVSENHHQEMKKVREQLASWRQKNYISQQIRQIDHELAGRKSRPIEGPLHQKMVRDIERACDLVSRWCNLGSFEEQGDWRTDQVKQLCVSVKETEPDVNAALEQLSASTGSASLVAVTACLKRAVKHLNAFLNPSLEADSAESTETPWEWFTYEAENLSVALSRRLLWLPELSLRDDGLPRDETAVAQVLMEAIEQKRTLHNAFAGWLCKQDYRFVERLLDAMHDDKDLDSLSRQYQEALDGSQAALDDRKRKTDELIEQTVVDGIIGEERTEFTSVLESMNSRTVLNFPDQYAYLENVQIDLGNAREKHLILLSKKWNELRKRLANSRIENANQERITNLISDELRNKDTRILEERLTRLAEIIEEGRELEEAWFSKPAGDTFREFINCAPRIEEWYSQSHSLQGIARDIREQTLGSGNFLEITKVQGEEYVRANRAWIRLRQQPPQKLENFHPLVVLLEYLGFDFKCSLDDAFQVVSSGKDWLLLNTVDVFASLPVRPIPQFGSQATGNYSVLCFWERPSTDAVSSRLRELHLTTSNILMLYLGGRLKDRQKRDITRSCQKEELTLAALDEDLLLFLATKEREARFSCFLRCALPLTLLNPYTPFQAGDVPPEMFFGREEMVKDLLDPLGSCLVFGGRQLGKSALLRHVMRQFHDPEQHRHAWVEDMNLIFDPNAGRDSIYVWRALREMFKRGQLLKPTVTTEKPEFVRRYLLDVMEEIPQRRVLVMFDEADDFLDADSRDGFPVVRELRGLMLKTQSRFKVIFTGLHNVQRFQGIPNQPLAHFGGSRSLCVGPLKPQAAQELVREPLESLGYCFEDNAAVLRILSYTNYHPGLIQLFCQELLKKLHSQRGNSLPPYEIKRDDVESVYRSSQVRDDIRKRFNWTLNLDLRYQAIAWSMIVDRDQTDSYSSVYSTGEILSLVRDWWPQGFGDEDAINNLQSLLEELCGLGVLYRDSRGYYQLKSPNLVRLMGTAGDIEDRLLELSEKEPPSSFEANNHHAPLANTRQYSPLSYKQERILASPQIQSGVGLIFSSEALGMSRLQSAFKRFAPEDSDEGTYTDIPIYVTDGIRFNEWLDENLQPHGRNKYNVVCLRPSERARENLKDLVDVALRFCARHRPRTGQQWFRVLFLLDPPSTWKWLSLPLNTRKNLENRANGVVSPLRWNLSGVRQRLTQHNMMDLEEVGKDILSQTGGWYLLLDTFFERCAKDLDDPHPVALELGRELGESGSELTKKFRKSLGLEVDEVVHSVLEFVCENDHVEEEYITPEMIEKPALRTEECTLAIEYLEKMGCIVRNSNTVAAETTVKKVMLSL